MKHNYVFYGLSTNAIEVRAFTEHLLRTNLQAEERGGKKSPVCIWGTHGIGKTELVQSIATELGWQFAYIAPAQFEEMGDLVGMPSIEDGVTKFRAPDWVPTAGGPGILLIDDVNRADDRILRGIMQLLQNYELVSWRLPARWQIVLTANPDGGDYSVTPMDNAMLTRMMHITMTFDPKAWARWAETAGVDSRCINFVLTYPEVAEGERTTPRSLVQFFQSIDAIPDFSEQLPLIQMLGSSCLDDATVGSFVSFVQQNLARLIAPHRMVETKNFARDVEQHLRELTAGKVPRVDILATMCTRFVNYLVLRKEKFSKEEIANVQRFLKLDFLPNDLRLSVLQDLVSASNPSLKKVMADPEVAMLLLQKM